jgi:hypothetical protein
MRSETLTGLLQEANEIVAIMVASHRTAASGRQSQIANPKSQISGS